MHPEIEPTPPAKSATAFLLSLAFIWASLLYLTQSEPAVQLTGRYNGENGNESMIPDFYGNYCNDTVHRKPLAIPEVAAMYNPNAPCCETELEVKRAWWQQVHHSFPWCIRMIQRRLLAVSAGRNGELDAPAVNNC